MSDQELLTVITTIISTLLFTGIAVVVITTTLVSLLVGLADAVVALGYKLKEVYGYSSHDSLRDTVDRDVVVV